MAVHVAEMYAALVAQRRQVFSALEEADPARLSEPADLSDGSILDTLARLAYDEHRLITHTLRRGPSLNFTVWSAEWLPAELTLAAVELAWAGVAALTRDFIRVEKPYDLVFPRRDLGGLGGTPEQVLWGIVMHEMGRMGEVAAACRRLRIPLPPLAPVDHLRRNPELGRWWMAEQY